MCGHATLASALVIFTQLDPGRARVSFATRESGSLTVEREGERLAMEVPAVPAEPIDAPEMLSRALGPGAQRGVGDGARLSRGLFR